MPDLAPPPLSFRRSAPSSVTHHPHAAPPPLTFRAHPSPTSSPARPIAQRSRPSSHSSLLTPFRLLPDAPSAPSLRSRSHNELRAAMNRGAATRVVSFGSAVTPASASGGSVTDGELSGSEGAPEQGRTSWEWPWDADDSRLRARSVVVCRREDSSGSGSSFGGERVEMWVRRGYGSRAVKGAATRSQSALAGERFGGRKVDGPRPFDMEGGERKRKRRFWRWRGIGFRRR